eukprot:TRINITY_DN26903_c0_g1_i1.p1 TRINITY_DN26903_c0_g1~~TRINITY_DN26903_c0_g1_i1.p1  ORF type:complete len:431 (+),score=48.94 TRINITY_DN26903_c0_g1_i1:52-1293(+)
MVVWKGLHHASVAACAAAVLLPCWGLVPNGLWLETLSLALLAYVSLRQATSVEYKVSEDRDPWSIWWVGIPCKDESLAVVVVPLLVAGFEGPGRLQVALLSAWSSVVIRIADRYTSGTTGPVSASKESLLTGAGLVLTLLLTMKTGTSLLVIIAAFIGFLFSLFGQIANPTTPPDAMRIASTLAAVFFYDLLRVPVGPSTHLYGLVVSMMPPAARYISSTDTYLTRWATAAVCFNSWYSFAYTSSRAPFYGLDDPSWCVLVCSVGCLPLVNVPSELKTFYVITAALVGAVAYDGASLLPHAVPLVFVMSFGFFAPIDWVHPFFPVVTSLYLTSSLPLACLAGAAFMRSHVDVPSLSFAASAAFLTVALLLWVWNDSAVVLVAVGLQNFIGWDGLGKSWLLLCLCRWLDVISHL